MNITIGDIVCPTHTDDDACTLFECLSNATSMTFECNATAIDNCCNDARVDCLAFSAACTEAACVDFNETLGRGQCNYTAVDSERCCTSNATCDALAGPCVDSVCTNVSTVETGFAQGVCTTPVERVCVDTTPDDRCRVTLCNVTSDACEEVLLSLDACPGACCFANGSCVDDGDAGMDEAWCLMDGGSTFFVNETCATGSCNCTSDAECPLPANKCEPEVCDPIIARCVVEAVVCDDSDPCTTDECLPDIGLCRHTRDWTCCTEADTSTCYHSGSPCLQVECIEVSNVTGTGQCFLQSIADPLCCESDADCLVNEDACSLAWCNHITDRCEDNDLSVVCGGDADGDSCTELRCNATNGECEETRVEGHMKCPGACCLPNATCVDGLTYFECTNATSTNGTWTDSDVSCDVVDCANITLPTPAPPTPQPTFPPATPVPTRSPTGVPTPAPTVAAPTLPSTLECSDVGMLDRSTATTTYHLGVYADAAATECNMATTTGSTTVYVVADLPTPVQKICFAMQSCGCVTASTPTSPIGGAVVDVQRLDDVCVTFDSCNVSGSSVHVLTLSLTACDTEANCRLDVRRDEEREVGQIAVTGQRYARQPTAILCDNTFVDMGVRTSSPTGYRGAVMNSVDTECNANCTLDSFYMSTDGPIGDDFWQQARDSCKNVTAPGIGRCGRGHFCNQNQAGSCIGIGGFCDLTTTSTSVAEPHYCRRYDGTLSCSDPGDVCDNDGTLGVREYNRCLQNSDCNLCDLSVGVTGNGDPQTGRDVCSGKTWENPFNNAFSCSVNDACQCRCVDGTYDSTTDFGVCTSTGTDLRALSISANKTSAVSWTEPLSVECAFINDGPLVVQRWDARYRIFVRVGDELVYFAYDEAGTYDGVDTGDLQDAHYNIAPVTLAIAASHTTTPVVFRLASVTRGYDEVLRAESLLPNAISLLNTLAPMQLCCSLETRNDSSTQGFPDANLANQEACTPLTMADGPGDTMVLFQDDFNDGLVHWTAGPTGEQRAHADTYNASGDARSALIIGCGYPLSVCSTAGWASTPGYGSNWQVVLVREFAFTSSTTFNVTWRYDTEPGFDFVRLRILDAASVFSNVYERNGTQLTYLEEPSVTFVSVGASIGVGQLRIEFTSDNIFDDQDGSFDSNDGAVQIDRVCVTDATPSGCFEFDANSLDGWLELLPPPTTARISDTVVFESTDGAAEFFNADFQNDVIVTDDGTVDYRRQVYPTCSALVWWSSMTNLIDDFRIQPGFFASGRQYVRSIEIPLPGAAQSEFRYFLVVALSSDLPTTQFYSFWEFELVDPDGVERSDNVIRFGARRTDVRQIDVTNIIALQSDQSSVRIQVGIRQFDIFGSPTYVSVSGPQFHSVRLLALDGRSQTPAPAPPPPTLGVAAPPSSLPRLCPGDVRNVTAVDRSRLDGNVYDWSEYACMQHATGFARCTCLAPAPAASEPPVALEEIDESVAEYARTLCRVINDCGDGSEALCGSVESMDDALLEHCIELGCCRYDDIPAERRKRMAQ